MSWFGFGGGAAEPCVYPESESPKTLADYEALAAKMLVDAKAVEKEGGYTPIPFTEAGHEDVKVSDLLVEGSPISCIRVEATMPCPAQQLFDIVTSPDLSIMTKFDDDVKTLRVHQKVSDSISLIYSEYKAPSLVTERNFVVARASYPPQEDGALYNIARSVNHDDFKTDSKYVRAVNHISCWIVRPIDAKSCRVTRIVRVDVKGWIPVAIINFYKYKGGLTMVRLRKMLAEINKK